MYAVIRHYRTGAGTVQAMARRVDVEVADSVPVDVGATLYSAIDTGDGTATTITLFPDEATFRASLPTVARVQESMAEFEVEEILLLRGEVMVSRATDGALTTVHAE